MCRKGLKKEEKFWKNEVFKEVGNCVRDRSLALRVFRSFLTDSFWVWYFQMVRETFPATEHHHFLVLVSFFVEKSIVCLILKPELARSLPTWEKRI